jgi:hypothetical protein
MSYLNKASFMLILLASCCAACSRPHSKAHAAAPVDVQQSATPQNTVAQATSQTPAITPTPELEVAVGNRLRVVPKVLKMKNERRRYDLNVTYPQIEGSASSEISNLNKRIRGLLAEQYDWMLQKPSGSDLRRYNKFPGVLNSINTTYEVTLATNDLLSIYVESYIYGIGAAHSSHHSFTVNYDLKHGKFLKLPDIFKHGVSYLQLLSRYCTDDLSKRFGSVEISYDGDTLAPKASNYESWNLTVEGLRINFDACRVLSCAGGKQAVNIPFDVLKPVLNLHHT